MASLTESHNAALPTYLPLGDGAAVPSASVFRRALPSAFLFIVSTCCLSLFAWTSWHDDGASFAHSVHAAELLGNTTGLRHSSLSMCSSGQTRWMWGDASMIGHWFAWWNPWRWSSWESIPDTISDLQGYLGRTRPVDIEIWGCGRDVERRYGSVVDVIQELGGSLSFHSMPFRFDSSVSRTLALVSSVAYEELHRCHASVSEWTCQKCKETGLSIEPGSMHHFYAKNHSLYGFVVKVRDPAPFADACLVSFRGTSNPFNRLADLTEIQIAAPHDWQCPSCYVHEGFLFAWQDLETEVVNTLKSMDCNAGVFLTGHSLGGALATLAAWPLKYKHHFNLSMIYTYESPRVGTTEFATAWDANIAKTVPSFRITYGDDPIPNMPCFWGKFVHVLYEVHYEKDGNLVVVPSMEAPCEEFSFGASVFTGRYYDHCHVPYVSDMCVEDFVHC